MAVRVLLVGLSLHAERTPPGGGQQGGEGDLGLETATALKTLAGLARVAPQQGHEGRLETVAEVLGHEGVDDGVDAAVGVGENGEGLSHRLQAAVVVLLHMAKGHQHVVYE